MRWTSMLAIYLLVWVMVAFAVLPFGVRSHYEAEVDFIPGQADGAPANFRPIRVLVRTTLISAALFALFYANYRTGWITAYDLNLFGRPPQAGG